MLNTKFIAMKKISLILTFTCICFQMLFSNNIENGEPAQLKKGDWFTIEFANRLEDYSTPVDTIDYSSYGPLKKLAFKCEVIDANERSINLNFIFERLFDLEENGEYFDSYFDQEVSTKSDGFQIGAEINLTSDSIKFVMPGEGFEEYIYSTFSREVFIKEKRMSSSEHGRSIALTDMKQMLEAYLRDWPKQNNNFPLKASGDIDVNDFKKYRILDTNLSVGRNINLIVNIPEGLQGEDLEIFATSQFRYFYNQDKKLFSKKLEGGNDTLSFYLSEQKLLALRYKSDKIKFVGTPGDTLRLTINANNGESAYSIVSKHQGDQRSLSLLGDNPFSFFKDMEKIHSVDLAVRFLNKKTEENIHLLDSLKHQLTANWYRRQMFETYYQVASTMLVWCRNKEIPANYSELKRLVAFQKIHPLYDYIILPDNYNRYVKNAIDNSFRANYESVSTNQGFTRHFGDIENYDIYDIMYWGYPKFLALKNIVYTDLEENGITSAQENYDKFLANCKYTPFKKELEEYYAEIKKIEPGEPVLELPLNFITHDNFHKNNGKYKIVYFLNLMEEDDKKRITENVSDAAEELDLKGKLELVIVYEKEKYSSVSKIGFPVSENFQTTYIGLEPDTKYWKDRNCLKIYGYYKIFIISPDNKIVSRTQSYWSIRNTIHQYIESQNQPKSHENRKAMILGAFISLLGTGFLAWIIIKINNRRIKKRESARRKLSELELKAIRSQMNPHFIFNAMGSIQNLMNHNQTEKANLYLSRFAKLMRMVLNSSNKKLVSLADELELIRLYLELEQLRVDFQFKVEVGESVNPETEEIPGMLLQPFVENAVIHGITPKGEGSIEIEISKAESNLVCSISDDGVGIDPTKTGNGNGLAMKFAEKRVNLLSEQLKTRMKLQVVNRSVSERKSGTKVTLIIPVE